MNNWINGICKGSDRDEVVEVGERESDILKYNHN